MICINKEKMPKNGTVGEAMSKNGGDAGRADGRFVRTDGRSAGLKSKEADAAGGLTSAQVAQSRERHGDNRLSRQREKGFFGHFVSNLNDPVIRVLLVALGLNLLLTFRGSDWVETVGIAVSVLLATGISTASQLGSQAAFARLQALSAGERCRVLRDGALCDVAVEQVVVGDVITLGAGEHIPADGVLIRGELVLDQSGLTGESREVKKRAGEEERALPEDGCSLFRGCSVLGGSGQMLVRRVGDATVLGGICREVQRQTRDSPLKLRLAKLARQISLLGYLAALLVAVAFLFHAFVMDSGFRPDIIRLKLTDVSYLVDTLLHALMLGLTVVVVAVPEGLPMMIAVVLSANMRRMVKQSVLVRQPAGIEAAGSMDILFTDKTGTLTGGRLRVGQLLCACSDHESPEALRRADRESFELYLLACRHNGEATLGGQGNRERAIGGNATDRALVESVARFGATGAQREGYLPFDSARKYAASVVRTREGRVLTLFQGAPERLVPWLADGQRTSWLKSSMQERIGARAAQGERVLLMAFFEGRADLDGVARGVFPPLRLICAVTMADRLRPEAKQAVSQLHGAGVQVVMITGDAPSTASYIARACGILHSPEQRVLTGSELSAMSDEQLTAVLPHLALVARALPSDKSRLVRLAQGGQRVVGMTGDGVNDAPALRCADVGFAMGSGTGVAQDAGDVIVLDDNLASIVRAVLYGRNIFKSIRKFITLQLTMNFCAVGVSMIGPFIGVNAPVTVVQMLWINLIMDTLGGLAFAGEAALPHYLQERPKRREEPILCRYMAHQILFLGGYTVGLCLLFLKHPTVRSLFRAAPGDLCHLTAFFALFIFSSVFNCFNARTDRLRPGAGLARNRAFLLVMGAILVVQILFVYLGGSVLRTMPLTARELGVTALLALSVLPAELLRKLLWRARRGKDTPRY